MLLATVVGWGLVIDTTGAGKGLSWLGFLLGPLGLGGRDGGWAYANLGVPVALVRRLPRLPAHAGGRRTPAGAGAAARGGTAALHVTFDRVRFTQADAVRRQELSHTARTTLSQRLQDGLPSWRYDTRPLGTAGRHAASSSGGCAAGLVSAGVARLPRRRRVGRDAHRPRARPSARTPPSPPRPVPAQRSAAPRGTGDDSFSRLAGGPTTRAGTTDRPPAPAPAADPAPGARGCSRAPGRATAAPAVPESHRHRTGRPGGTPRRTHRIPVHRGVTPTERGPHGPAPITRAARRPGPRRPACRPPAPHPRRVLGGRVARRRRGARPRHPGHRVDERGPDAPRRRARPQHHRARPARSSATASTTAPNLSRRQRLGNATTSGS